MVANPPAKAARAVGNLPARAVPAVDSLPVRVAPAADLEAPAAQVAGLVVPVVDRAAVLLRLL